MSAGLRLLWSGMAAATLLFGLRGPELAEALGAPWAMELPAAWQLPAKAWIGGAMSWLVEEARLGPVAFADLTRGLAWIVEQPYRLALALLAEGFVRGVGDAAVMLLPPLSWLAVIVAVAALGHHARDWPLALLAGGCFLYLAMFGQWQGAMVTLASIAIAVPLGVLGGLLLGIAAFRSRGFERALAPVLDLMQTIPVFAYLLPILFLFGFGPVSALVATVIYAMPPMVRVTTLSLRGVDPELRDLGLMAGCTPRQLLWRVLVPSAAPGLMIGVNQVIMLSLNMVIIASMIGAGGLGFDVLTALRKLDIGAGVEAGLAITVLAIAVDRLSQALAARRPDAPTGRAGSLIRRHPRTVLVLAVALAGWGLGMVVPAVRSWPEAWEITTAPLWGQLVEWLNVNFFDAFEALKTAVLTGFLIPIKRFLGDMPWPWGVLLVAFLGWRSGGPRLGLLCGGLMAAIAVTGQWEKAMVTVYLCGASVIVACAIGIPLGILAALNRAAGKVIGVVIDTLQTLPSFVYLIPVVMLFRVGDFTAMIAVVLYALAPAVRYTAHGIAAVDPQTVEAGIVSGCTPGQLLARIRLPLALPAILLGVNQTIMLALSMLVITALVGTRDLGQEVYIALAKADVGRGLVAGLAIAFLATAADRIVRAGAAGLRARYGLAA